MPLSRYRLRNEYSLADPELYRAADKDDPEALLEAVAMAGLVGLLRQLGDLAEFAAEIFHDLHEEVMATAARGHGLMARVQQLEVEFPLIEKALLSQTSPSSFFCNKGTDWRPNLHMDQNVITRGDLPRFVMNSYEECRGPPRLFLLDKFDIAGAGACLKRYTDPSFFKVELLPPGMTTAESQREKKIRKAKKKGSRWRKRETPEMLPAAHTKLHQLFLEECVENGISDPACRVKLKRRLHGFPFDSKSGEGYMHKFLKDYLPEQETSAISSPLTLPWITAADSGLEIHEISTVSSDKESMEGKQSLYLSPNIKGIDPPASIDCFSEDVGYGDISILPDLNHNSKSDQLSSTQHKFVEEKEILVDGGDRKDEIVDCCHSDDVVSEMDNYMDALATIDSEMETEGEAKPKNYQGILYTEKQLTDSVANEEEPPVQFSDSQSVGNSTASDDGISSSKKGIYSSSYSGSPSTSVDIVLVDGDYSPNASSSLVICEAITEKSSEHSSRVLLTQPAEDKHSVDASTKVTEITSSSSVADFTQNLLQSDQVSVLKKDTLSGQQLDEVTSSNSQKINTRSLNCSENETNFLVNSSGMCNLSSRCDNEDPNVFSTASVSNIPGNAYDLKSIENSFNDASATEYEDIDETEKLVHDHIDSPQSPILNTEVQLFTAVFPELGLSKLDLNSEAIIADVGDAICSGGDMNKRFTPLKDGQDIHNSDIKNNLVSELASNVVTLDCSVQVDDTTSKEQGHGQMVSNINLEEVGENSPGIDIVETDVCNQSAQVSELSNDVMFDCDSVQLDDLCSKDHGHDQMVSSIHSEEVGDNIPSIDIVETDVDNLNVLVYEVSNDVTLNGDSVQVDLIAQRHDQVVNSIHLEEVGEKIPSIDIVETDVSNLNVCSSSQVCEPWESDAMVIAGVVAIPNDDTDKNDDVITPSPNLKEFQELNFVSLDHDKFNNNGTCLPDTCEEFYAREKEEVAVYPDFNSFQEKLILSDCNESDCLYDSSGSSMSPEVKNGLIVDDAALLTISTECSGQDSELRSNQHQQGDAIDNAIDASSSVTNQQEIISPDLNLPYTVSAGQSEEEMPNSILDASLAGKMEHSFFPIEAQPIVPSLVSSSQDSKLNSLENSTDLINKDDVTLPTLGEPNMPEERKVDLGDGQLVLECPRKSSPEIVEDNSLFPTLAELRFQAEQKLKLHADQFDMEFPLRVGNTGGASSFPLCAEIRSSTDKKTSLPSGQVEVKSLEHVNYSNLVHDGMQFNNSENFPVTFPIQPPASEVLPQPGISNAGANEQSVGASNFINPLFSMLSDPFQIGLEEMPPLPPLPPIQWRMGRLQEANSLLDRDSVQKQMDSFQQMLPSLEDNKIQIGHAPNTGSAQPSSPFLLHSSETKTDSLHSFEPLQSNMVHSSHENSLTFDATPKMDSASPSTSTEIPQNNFHAVNGEGLDSSSTELSTGDMAAAVNNDSQDKDFRSLHALPPETGGEIEKLEQNSSFSVGKVINYWNSCAPSTTVEDHRPPYVFQTSWEESAWSTTEESDSNTDRPAKLPRPRNPLIDAVVAHDKSKLRKVTERVQPQIHKVDERDSLLEQIRAKSFSLKPAAVGRPNIQGPATNLKVAAILEKANAIRQALAGSDEDDDCWSDS